MRLPTIDSATFKGAVTALQTLMAFFVAAIASPEFMELLTKYYPEAMPLLSAIAGVVAFIIGVVRTDVKNY